LESRVQDPIAFAKSSAILPLVEPQTGFGVDVSFVDSPYLRQALSRAITVQTDGYPVRFLSVEDIVIHKVIAQRDHDRSDAIELIDRYPDLDQHYVEHWLSQFEMVLDQPLVSLFRQWLADSTR
jgi:hypothetical protein